MNRRRCAKKTDEYIYHDRTHASRNQEIENEAHRLEIGFAIQSGRGIIPCAHCDGDGSQKAGNQQCAVCCGTGMVIAKAIDENEEW